MLKTKTMQKLGAKLRNKPFSKCSQHTHDSDAYWECLVRHNAVSGYHQSSTCKMGSASDTTAVVGPDLRQAYIVYRCRDSNFINGHISISKSMIQSESRDIHDAAHLTCMYSMVRKMFSANFYIEIVLYYNQIVYLSPVT